MTVREKVWSNPGFFLFFEHVLGHDLTQARCTVSGFSSSESYEPDQNYPIPLVTNHRRVTLLCEGEGNKQTGVSFSIPPYS